VKQNIMKLCSVIVGVFALVGSQAAVAALDVTEAVTFIEGDVTTALTTVGTALIVLAALVMGYKWVKATFFG
jgi:hypothetical protein